MAVIANLRNSVPAAGKVLHRVRVVGRGVACAAGMSFPHENLVAWQRADDLFIAVHRLADGFPAHERFGLASQLRRAAYSVPANIVEGMARRSRRDRLRFLNISEGSLAEVTYCLHVAERLAYITTDVHARYYRQALQVGAPLVGLIRSLTLPPSD